MANIPETTPALVELDHGDWIANRFASAALALSLAVLPFQRLPSFLVDLRQELSCFRCTLVHPPEYELVKTAPQRGPRVELAASDENHAIHVTKPDLPLVQFVQNPHPSVHLATVNGDTGANVENNQPARDRLTVAVRYRRAGDDRLSDLQTPNQVCVL